MNAVRFVLIALICAEHLLSTHSHPLSISELGRAVLDVPALHAEYMSVPSNLVTMNEVPTGAEDKNRYGDVLPNPHSRVALFLKFGIGNSDYINANYIRGFDGSAKAYIATQGPLPWTMADFWRMVWEQKSTVIIMNTGLEERGQVKCAQYWPDTARHVTSEQYGDIEVTIQRRTSTPTYTLTNFQIKHVQRQVVRDIVHYWYTAWPDHGVPDTNNEMLEFVLASRQARDNPTMPGPVIVHCSAGIGRTGVFIGADMGMRELERNNSVDVQRILASMRQDRGGMIQTVDQYVFLHRLLYEYARRINARRVSCPDSPEDTYMFSTADKTDPVRCIDV